MTHPYYVTDLVEEFAKTLNALQEKGISIKSDAETHSRFLKHEVPGPFSHTLAYLSKYMQTPSQTSDTILKFSKEIKDKANNLGLSPDMLAWDVAEAIEYSENPSLVEFREGLGMLQPEVA